LSDYSDAWDLLNQQLTPARRQRMLDVVQKRTAKLRLVVQDVHQPHNVSACLRSADAFGVLNCDVVTLNEKFSPSTVARGVHHWLHIQHFQDVASCVKNLKAHGFKIAAALPTQSSVPLQDLPFDQPLALVFGNEHAGISNEWLQHCDLFYTIPMVGMVESLNISVSAAISLFEARSQMLSKMGEKSFYIDEKQQKEILNQWICQQIPSYEDQLEYFRKKT